MTLPIRTLQAPLETQIRRPYVLPEIPFRFGSLSSCFLQGLGIHPLSIHDNPLAFVEVHSGKLS